jgi:predicted CoA-binding protein
MNHDSYSDGYIRGILNTVKTIAMVGASEKDNRPSYFAFKYLLERGYNMIPVNPGHAGESMLGQKIYPRLADIPVPVDMVDNFRSPQYAPAIVQEALALARTIAAKSALTVKIGKVAFYRQLEMTLADAYGYASQTMVENMLARDAEEGIGAFIEKRAPKWEDR